MDNILAKANYFLALEKKSMTDEIRNEYIAHIEKNPNYYIVFSALLKTVMRQFRESKISKEEAIELLKNEFIGLKLNDSFGNIDELLPLFELLFTKRSADIPISMEMLKKYIDVADKININSIVYCIYYAVLNALLTSELISIDIDFSEKVVDFIKEYKVMNEDDTIFLNTISEAILFAE